MCEENYFYNRSAPGCQQCPSCYSLVRDKVRTADTLFTDRRKFSPAHGRVNALLLSPGEPAEAEASRAADSDR